MEGPCVVCRQVRPLVVLSLGKQSGGMCEPCACELEAQLPGLTLDRIDGSQTSFAHWEDEPHEPTRGPGMDPRRMRI